MITSDIRARAEILAGTLKTELKSTTRSTLKNTQVAAEASATLDAMVRLCEEYDCPVADKEMLLSMVENTEVKAELGVLWDASEDLMLNGELTADYAGPEAEALIKSSVNVQATDKMVSTIAKLEALGAYMGLTAAELTMQLDIAYIYGNDPGAVTVSLEANAEAVKEAVEGSLTVMLQAKKNRDTSLAAEAVETTKTAVDISINNMSLPDIRQTMKDIYKTGKRLTGVLDDMGAVLLSDVWEEGDSDDEAAVEEKSESWWSSFASELLKSEGDRKSEPRTPTDRESELQAQLDTLGELKVSIDVSLGKFSAVEDYYRDVKTNLEDTKKIISKMEEILEEMKAEELPDTGNPTPAQPIPAVDNLISTFAAAIKNDLPELSATISKLQKQSNTTFLHNMENSVTATKNMVGTAWDNITALYKHTCEDKPASEDRVDADGNPMPGPRSEEWQAKSLELMKDTASSCIAAADSTAGTVKLFSDTYNAIMAIKDPDERTLSVILPLFKFTVEKLVDKNVPEKDKKEVEQSADLMSCIASLLGVTLKATDQFGDLVDLLGGK